MDVDVFRKIHPLGDGPAKSVFQETVKASSYRDAVLKVRRCNPGNLTTIRHNHFETCEDKGPLRVSYWCTKH